MLRWCHKPGYTLYSPELRIARCLPGKKVWRFKFLSIRFREVSKHIVCSDSYLLTLSWYVELGEYAGCRSDTWCAIVTTFLGPHVSVSVFAKFSAGHKMQVPPYCHQPRLSERTRYFMSLERDRDKWSLPWCAELVFSTISKTVASNFQMTGKSSMSSFGRLSIY